jgi:DNA primase
MSTDAAELVLSLVPHLADGASRAPGYILVRCPFHGGGQEKTPSCSVRRDAPVFFCHGCKAGGHIVKILRSAGISDASSKVALDGLRVGTGFVQRASDNLRAVYGNDPYRGKYILDDADTLTPYRGVTPESLVRSGFTAETLDFFEVGLDSANLRVTYPIRNIYGELVGISGRALGDAVPRYKIYKRELTEMRPELRLPDDYSVEDVKKATMWNFHTVYAAAISAPDPEPLVITEGFKACMWTWQSGYKQAVALIGSYLSERQVELLARLAMPVLLFLDNNEAGVIGTDKAAYTLHRYGVPFRIARYPDEREQPDALEPEELAYSLNQPLDYYSWRISL